ncbi:hypothetical protein ABS858_04400 [Vibrio neptunius]|uniref:hypothetical protein n=1 Tax=Vibrio neptunius TaxID=170651 RepID=UPI00331476A5
MKTKKFTNRGIEPSQEPQIAAFVEQCPPSPRTGMIMRVAILANAQDGLTEPKPYRTFKTIGKDEYFSLCEHLESIGLSEYSIKNTDFDAIFYEPVFEVEFFNEGML